MKRSKREVQFRRDVIAAWVYLAERSDDAPDDWKAKLNETIRRVCETPILGHRRPDIPDDLRAIAVGSHVVIYRVETKRIVFVRLIHGARDFTRFFPKLP